MSGMRVLKDWQRSPIACAACSNGWESHVVVVLPLQAGLAWALLSDWGWRWLVVVSSVPLLLLMLLYPFLPESPFWLLATGQTARAQELLGWIARLNGRSLPKGRLQHSKAAAAEKVCSSLKAFFPTRHQLLTDPFSAGCFFSRLFQM